MKKYCFNYPTCPICHEPHNTGSVLKKVEYKEAYELSTSKNKYYCNENKIKYDGLQSELVDICLVKCSNCGSYYRNHIDLSDFEKTREYMNSDESIYPFYWGINLNPIEKSYVEWIPAMIKRENYCIYWPWEEVKFLPIFISEYYNEFPNEKIVVLDIFNKKTDYISKPDIYTSLKYLYTYEDESEFPDDIKNELRPLKNKTRNYILFKNDFIHYHIKFLSVENQLCEDFSDDYKEYSKKLTTTIIRKKFEDNYGKGTVKRIDLEGSNKGGNYKTDTPLLDIKATYELQWGGTPKVNIFDYWKILANYDSLKNVIKDDNNYSNNLKIINNNIFIMNYYSKTLIEDITSINPDIIIIKDTEDIFLNYNHSHRYDLINYINSNDNLTTISFSKDKNKRFRYNYLIKNNLDKCMIHSWDNDEIINQIDLTGDSLLSSNNNELKKIEDLNIDYEEISSLNIIDEISHEIVFKFDKEAKKYFKFLIQTPIQIMDDANEFNFKFNNRDVGYWFERIYALNDEDFLNKVLNSFAEVYLDEEKPFNPLINQINKIVNDNLNQYDKIILICSSNYYKNIMKYIFVNELNKNKLIICKWNEINESKSENILLISTIKPYDSFDLNKYNINRYIFVGSPESIIEIKELVMKKTSCDITRPLINLIGENLAPKLLYDCFINIPDVEEKVNFQNTILKTEEINIKKQEPEKNSSILNDSDEKERKDRFLHENQKVILLLNELNEGMFIPKKNSLTYKKDNSSLGVFDFNSTKNKKENLIDKQVIIDNNGFNRSYKEFFIKFMIENYTTNLNDYPHDSLRNFKQLNDKAYSWLHILNDLLNKMHENSLNDNILKTKKDFAQKIKSYITTKYTLESIVHWLNNPEIINTSEGLTEIYSLEHPRNVSSLISLYKGLSEDFNLDLTEKDAIKTYQAGIYLQKIRRSFLQNKKIPIAYVHLYNKFINYLNEIIAMSKVFTVKSIQDVKLNREVKSYKIIKNYEDYL